MIKSENAAKEQTRREIPQKCTATYRGSMEVAKRSYRNGCPRHCGSPGPNSPSQTSAAHVGTLHRTSIEALQLRLLGPPVRATTGDKSKRHGPQESLRCAPFIFQSPVSSSAQSCSTRSLGRFLLVFLAAVWPGPWAKTRPNKRRRHDQQHGWRTTKATADPQLKNNQSE